MYMFAFGHLLHNLMPLQIHDLKFSNDGSKFLVISGTCQAKLFDRDGEEQYVWFMR